MEEDRRRDTKIRMGHTQKRRMNKERSQKLTEYQYRHSNYLQHPRRNHGNYMATMERKDIRP